MLSRGRVIHRLTPLIRLCASETKPDDNEQALSPLEGGTAHIPAPKIEQPTVSPITRLGTPEFRPTREIEPQNIASETENLKSETLATEAETREKEPIITWLGTKPKSMISEKPRIKEESKTGLTSDELLTIEAVGYDLMPKFSYHSRVPRIKEPLELNTALERVLAESDKRRDDCIRLAISLAVNPRKSNEFVRGVSVLPHGTGKTPKIAVFAEGMEAQQAREAKAEIVGGIELIQEVLETEGEGMKDVDYCIATPAMMAAGMAKLGRILGPRGLMPNPKLGTLTEKVAEMIESLRAGRIEFRVDRSGNLNAVLGTISFGVSKLAANVLKLGEDVAQARPEMFQKRPLTEFINRVTLSSPFSRGYPIRVTTFESDPEP